MCTSAPTRFSPHIINPIEEGVQRALRRAARRALLWEIEAAELARACTSLTQLGGVGPYIEKLIREGLANPHRPFFRGLLRVLYSLFRLHRKYEQYRVASATA